MVENYALLGYYVAISGNSLPKFLDTLSFPSSRAKNSRILAHEDGIRLGCPETSVGDCHYSLSNSPEARSSHLPLGGSLKSRRVLIGFGTGLEVMENGEKNCCKCWESNQDSSVVQLELQPLYRLSYHDSHSRQAISVQKLNH